MCCCSTNSMRYQPVVETSSAAATAASVEDVVSDFLKWDFLKRDILFPCACPISWYSVFSYYRVSPASSIHVWLQCHYQWHKELISAKSIASVLKCSTTVRELDCDADCRLKSCQLLRNYTNKNSSGDEIANVNFYAVRPGKKLPEFAEITQNNAITPFKVIQGHRFWYQSKAHIRFPISA